MSSVSRWCSRVRLRAVSAVLSAVLCVAGMASASLAISEDQGAEGSKLAPFSLRAVDGGSFDSKTHLSGKVSLVAFWRVGQEYAVPLLEELTKIREEFPADKLGIVTVVAGEADSEKVAALVKEHGLSLSVVLDPDYSLYGALGVVVSPTTWFIDDDGVQRFKYPGYRRNFPVEARANIEFLLGKISAEERTARATPSKAPVAAKPAAADARYKLARRLLAAGKRGSAKVQLLRAWKGEPPTPAAGIDLGLIYLEDGRTEDALEILEAALELIPTDPRAIGAKGVALMRQGKEDDGAGLLRQALETDVAEPILYYELAVFTEGKGAFDEACRYYKRGIDLMLEERRRQNEQ